MLAGRQGTRYENSIAFNFVDIRLVVFQIILCIIKRSIVKLFSIAYYLKVLKKCHKFIPNEIIVC